MPGRDTAKDKALFAVAAESQAVLSRFAELARLAEWADGWPLGLGPSRKVSQGRGVGGNRCDIHGLKRAQNTRELMDACHDNTCCADFGHANAQNTEWKSRSSRGRPWDRDRTLPRHNPAIAPSNYSRYSTKKANTYAKTNA